MTKAKGGKRDKIVDEGYYKFVLEGEAQSFHDLEERDIARAEGDRVSEESEIIQLVEVMADNTARSERGVRKK